MQWIAQCGAALGLATYVLGLAIIVVGLDDYRLPIQTAVWVLAFIWAQWSARSRGLWLLAGTTTWVSATVSYYAMAAIHLVLDPTNLYNVSQQYPDAYTGQIVGGGWAHIQAGLVLWLLVSIIGGAMMAGVSEALHWLITKAVRRS